MRRGERRERTDDAGWHAGSRALRMAAFPDPFIPRVGSSLSIQIRGFEMAESRIWRNKVLFPPASWLPFARRAKELRWPDALASTSGGERRSRSGAGRARGKRGLMMTSPRSNVHERVRRRRTAGN